MEVFFTFFRIIKKNNTIKESRLNKIAAIDLDPLIKLIKLFVISSISYGNAFIDTHKVTQDKKTKVISRNCLSIFLIID